MINRLGVGGDIVAARQARRLERPTAGSVAAPIKLPNKRQIRKFVRGFGLAGDIAPRRPMVRSAAVPAQPLTQPLPRIRRPIQPPEVRRPEIRRPVTPVVPRAKAKPAAEPKTRKTAKQIWEYAQYPLISIVALASAYSAVFGQWIIAVYGGYAIVFRRDSRVSFGLALFLLITIPLFQLINQSAIAENVAVYVYELLVIGTIQALIELHKTNKMHN